MKLRWQTVLLGAAAFLTAHIIERTMWTAWFADRSLVPWFTNSGGAVLVTVTFMFVAGIAAGRGGRNRDERLHGAIGVAVGGVATMLVALVASDTGRLVPIAFTIGAVLIIAGVFAGTFLVHGLKTLSDGRR